MKVIIAYASAGAGHLKAAESIHKYLRENRGDIDVKLVDILDYSSGLLKFSYRRGYSFLVHYGLFLWAAAFYLTRVKLLRILTAPVASLINLSNTRGFARFLLREAPDYMISTHFLPPDIAGHLKNKGRIKSTLITVITDFGVHPYWLSAFTDFYYVASEYTKGLLIKEKVAESRIRVCGIPIDEKFLKRYDKSALCVKFGIKSDMFTVLISTGSFGIGPIEKMASLLCAEMQVLVVCANNKKLKLILERKGLVNTRVFGFVDNMQELMAVSDVIITKPGGLSISEVLVMRLAPFFISPIPGQESGNVAAMKHYGIDTLIGSAPELKKKLREYRNNIQEAMRIKEGIEKIRKPHSTAELCDALR